MELWPLIVLGLGGLWSWVDYENRQDLTNLNWKSFFLDTLELMLQVMALIVILYKIEEFNWVRAFISFDLLFMSVAVLLIEVWRKKGPPFWMTAWVVVFACRQSGDLYLDLSVLKMAFFIVFKLALFRLIMNGFHLRFSLSHPTPRLGEIAYYLTAAGLISFVYLLCLTRVLPALL